MNRDHEKVTYGTTVTNERDPDQAERQPLRIRQFGVKMPHEIQRDVDGRRLEARRPGKDWFRQRALERRFAHSGGGELYDLSIWMRRRILAISTCVHAEAPNGVGSIPQWHISFTNEGRRCTDEEVRMSLASFRLTGADEDNHEPGMARHFWMPLDPKRRVDCECKTTEKVMIEPDGHKWTTPVDDRECYGCKHEVEMAAVGVARPCPVHPVKDDRALAAGYALRHAEITHKIPEGMMLGEGGLVPNDVKGEPIKGLLVDSLEPDPNYRGPKWGDSKLPAILAAMRRQQGLADKMGVSVGYHVGPAPEPDRHVEAIMIVGDHASAGVMREVVAAKLGMPEAHVIVQRRTHNADFTSELLLGESDAGEHDE